jgi:DNA-binding transcriptional ArsR family regulator
MNTEVTMNTEAGVLPVEDAVEADVSPAVALFRSLADPARLAILRHLTLGEHRVVDLTAHLGLAQSTTSAHLACLRDCGLVSVRTVGRSSVYSLAVADELMGVFGAAERMLAATGDAVTLCPTNIASPTDVADPTDVAGPMNLAGATNRGTVPS